MIYSIGFFFWVRKALINYSIEIGFRWQSLCFVCSECFAGLKKNNWRAHVYDRGTELGGGFWAIFDDFVLNIVQNASYFYTGMEPEEGAIAIDFLFVDR